MRSRYFCLPGAEGTVINRCHAVAHLRGWTIQREGAGEDREGRQGQTETTSPSPPLQSVVVRVRCCLSFPF